LRISRKARADVSEIIAEFNLRTDDSINRRVSRSWLYIIENGKFPRPIVTMKKPDGISLIDGNHRLAAFELVQGLPDAQFAKEGYQRPSRDQEVWVGTHSKDEVPDG
jgi:hypothetical protein